MSTEINLRNYCSTYVLLRSISLIVVCFLKKVGFVSLYFTFMFVSVLVLYFVAWRNTTIIKGINFHLCKKEKSDYFLLDPCTYRNELQECTILRIYRSHRLFMCRSRKEKYVRALREHEVWGMAKWNMELQ